MHATPLDLQERQFRFQLDNCYSGIAYALRSSNHAMATCGTQRETLRQQREHLGQQRQRQLKLNCKFDQELARLHESL